MPTAAAIPHGNSPSGDLPAHRKFEDEQDHGNSEGEPEQYLRDINRDASKTTKAKYRKDKSNGRKYYCPFIIGPISYL